MKKLNERRQALLEEKKKQVDYWALAGAVALDRQDVKTMNHAHKQLRRIQYTVAAVEAKGKFKLSPFVKATKRTIKESLSVPQEENNNETFV